LGIDYCCGGKKTLEAACAVKSLDLPVVVRELEAVDAAGANTETDWTQAPLSQLADHIVATHHDYLRRELPRLEFLTDKVARAHGERHPELHQVRDIFAEFKAELDSHMVKEEHILFPMCRKLDTATEMPSFHCGSIANPIRVMESEHDSAGDALAALRELTHDFTPPADACNTYRVMLDSLRMLEADMHQHVHKENNILFPRAVATEAELKDASSP
jgi:regulator of cell morphogenesis and NO signaling